MIEHDRNPRPRALQVALDEVREVIEANRSHDWRLAVAVRRLERNAALAENFPSARAADAMKFALYSLAAFAAERERIAREPARVDGVSTNPRSGAKAMARRIQTKTQIARQKAALLASPAAPISKSEEKPNALRS